MLFGIVMRRFFFRLSMRYTFRVCVFAWICCSFEVGMVFDDPGVKSLQGAFISGDIHVRGRDASFVASRFIVAAHAGYLGW